MAEILPFRGVLYDPATVGDVTAVVAPPYDVIGPAEQAVAHSDEVTFSRVRIVVVHSPRTIRTIAGVQR